MLDQRKQAISHWSQNPNKISGKNLTNKKREPSRQFRNKRGDISGTKLMNLTMNSKNKNIRDRIRE
jgi:hypothetical protein